MTRVPHARAPTHAPLRCAPSARDTEHQVGRITMADESHAGDGSSPNHGNAPIIEALPVGQLAANCYLVVCPETRDAALLDPGDEAARVLRRVRELGAAVTSIIHTHGHFDHISATEEVLAGLNGDPAL